MHIGMIQWVWRFFLTSQNVLEQIKKTIQDPGSLSFTHPQNGWIPIPQDVDLEFSHDFALDLSGRMSIQRPAAQHWRGVTALGLVLYFRSSFNMFQTVKKP